MSCWMGGGDGEGLIAEAEPDARKASTSALRTTIRQSAKAWRMTSICNCTRAPPEGQTGAGEITILICFDIPASTTTREGVVMKKLLAVLVVLACATPPMAVAQSATDPAKM